MEQLVIEIFIQITLFFECHYFLHIESDKFCWSDNVLTICAVWVIAPRDSQALIIIITNGQEDSDSTFHTISESRDCLTTEPVRHVLHHSE